ncbi:NACHT domain-containing protein [Actinokineospora enzanensis]|uniref:NACHT domain-containing protein n=1 Tax=Actinokineospora enzanensis TaxID=155975 RepID=UPI0012EC1297|nr:hypothetical protein [Actinokineospora enzanensis]
MDDREPPGTHNVVSGVVHGPVIQAETITGGIHHHAPTPESVALSLLRTQVRDQWATEARSRDLLQPRPLRLRWHTAADRVRSRDSGVIDGSLLHEPDDTRPAAQQLVEEMRDGPRNQLVVLGVPGAGKSTLAILYTLAALDLTATVPVLLSIAGWNPDEPLRAWCTRRIVEDYPGHSRELVARLLSAGDIVPVLDGLDEMPSRGRVLDQVERSGLRLVLTCRGDEYAQAVTAAGHPLPDAAVVDIRPVVAADIADFLRQGEDAETDRWSTVLHDTTVASALSTPLMISLARRVYRRPADPATLRTHDTAEEIRDHLVDRYLPAVYPDPREQRWLTFLAHHVKDQGGPDYEWWRLARALPRHALTIPLVLALLIFGTAIGACVEAVMPTNRSVPPGTVFGALGGLLIGVVAAIRTTSDRAGSGQRDAVRDTVAAAVALVVAAALMTGIGLLVAGKWTRMILRNLEHDLPLPILIPAVAVLLVVMLTHGLSRSRAPRPHRVRPARSQLVNALGSGLGAAVAVGPVAVVTMLAWPLVSGWLLVFTAVVALLVGLGRWLTAPAAEDTAVTPAVLLRADRDVLLFTGGMSGLVVAVLVWVGMRLFLGVNPELDDSVRESWTFPVIIGLFVTTCVIAASGSAWVTYTVARLHLATTRRLPLRLSRFLRHAHRKGVLRQTGPAYQFRHLIVRDHLAERYPAPNRRRVPEAQPRA